MILEARLGDTGVDEVIYSFTLPTKNWSPLLLAFVQIS